MKRWIAILAAIMMMCMTFPAALAEGETITLKKDTLNIVVGKTATISATVSPKAARSAGVTYFSGDPTVATVDTKGKVTGVSAGSCVITVICNANTGVTAAVTVNVYVPVQKLALTASASSVDVGGTIGLTPTITPENATNQVVTYKSSNIKVAAVDANGVVTGLAKGRATITATATDGSKKSNRVTVTITQPVEDITLSTSASAFKIGTKVAVKAKVLPASANHKAVTWSVSDPALASITSRGIVTLLAPGAVTVTATSQANPGVSASLTLESRRLATQVALQRTEASILVNGTLKIVENGAELTEGGVIATYSLLPADVTYHGVTFKSSHTKVAVVDENGVVTGVGPGKATITVTADDGSKKKDSLTVTVIQPVTGVSFKKDEIRVGVGNRGSLTAVLQPANATDKRMTWTSADSSIATVSGSKNKVTIHGKAWGDTTITGTTADGGYSVTATVHIGSFSKALKVKSLTIRNGKPYLSITNLSNMNITQIRYQMLGYDENAIPVPMSTISRSPQLLTGTYEHTLAPGETTGHGRFSFVHPSTYPNLQRIDFLITGYSTDTGFVYNIPDSHLNWVEYDSDLYIQTQAAKQ